MQILENNGKSVLDILKEKDSVCIPTHTLDCILEDEEVTLDEIKDYLDAIRNLSRGNYDYKPKTRFVRILFADLARFIESNNESYVVKASRNIDNGKKGGRPRKTQWVSLGFENNPRKGDNDNVYDNDNDYDNGNDCETIEEDSPIVVVKKEDNNNSSLETPKIKAVVNIAPNPQEILGKPTTEEVVDLIANFEAGKESYKNVIVSAHRIITRMDGAELDKKGKAALNLLKDNDYWRLAVNNSFFCNYDMSNIFKVGDAINKIVLSFGIEEAIKIVSNLNKSVLNKYDDKSAEEKVAIYIGSILKAAKDCKQ